MYRMSSLVILFVVGSSHRDLVHAEIKDDGGLSPSDLGLNPKQFNEIKIVVTKVLKSYISTPKNLFIQKDSRQFLPPQLNAKVLCDNIFNEIGKFLHNLGLKSSHEKSGETSLTRSGKPYVLLRDNNRDAIIHGVFDFLEKLLRIADELADIIFQHLDNNDYLEKGYSPSELSMPEVITRGSPHTLKFVSFTDNLENYLEAFFNCLNTTITSFDLATAFAILAKHSPRVTRNIVTNRLSKPIPKHPYTQDRHYTDFDAMICRVVVENPSSDIFEDCLKQCQSMNQCILRRMEEYLNTTHQSKWRFGKQFSRNIKILNTTCDVRPNTTSIIIICDNHNYRNVGVVLLSIILKLLGGSFVRSAASRNVIENLGNLIVQTKLGSEIMQEMNGLLEIYQVAAKREQYLLTKSESDPRVMRQYNKHSRQLWQYTKSLSDIAMKLIDQIRGMASTIEEALIRTVSSTLGVNLSNNFRAIRTFATFWQNLKESLAQNFNSTLHTKPQIPQDFSGLNRSLTRHKNQDLTDGYRQNIFDLSPVFNRDWFTSMRSIARTNTRQKPNTIMTLANTFLLATMFYECIVILAGAIYRTENEEDTGTQPIYQPVNEHPNVNHGPPPYDYDYYDSLYRRK